MLPKEEQKSDSKVTEDNSASFSEFWQEKPVTQEFCTQSKKKKSLSYLTNKSIGHSN